MTQLYFFKSEEWYESKKPRKLQIPTTKQNKNTVNMVE